MKVIRHVSPHYLSYWNHNGEWLQPCLQSLHCQISVSAPYSPARGQKFIHPCPPVAAKKLFLSPFHPRTAVDWQNMDSVVITTCTNLAADQLGRNRYQWNQSKCPSTVWKTIFVAAGATQKSNKVAFPHKSCTGVPHHLLPSPREPRNISFMVFLALLLLLNPP